jgi:hypothetical protein
MSHSSHISIRSLQHPFNKDWGSFSPAENYYDNMNPAFYHPHNTHNLLGINQSAYGIRFSGSCLESTTDTTAVHSRELQYLPNSDAQGLDVQPSSHHFLPEGIGGNSTPLVPSFGPNVEPKDPSLPHFASQPPDLAPISSTGAPAFFDIKATLLPRISSHVQEAAGPDGRRQWYCTFPHCTHSPFSRRDRAEVHVASIHLNEKRIYCNGSCGKAGW